MKQVGVQHNGSSPPYTKRMAIDAVRSIYGTDRLGAVADIGGGRGELSEILAGLSATVYLLDYSPPSTDSVPSNVIPFAANLNEKWPIPDAAVEFAVSLEVIEHVENPRHFVREMKRIVRPGGYLFMSTPNNHSLSSKFTFLIRGQHRLFQEPSYPAHITPLLRCDFERIGTELELDLIGWSYSNHDTIPRLHWRLPLGGQLFSDSIGVLYRRPH